MNAARRVTRQTATFNLNDENKLHGQISRVKQVSTQGLEGVNKPWTAATRKRAALGDVSNVHNKENQTAKTKTQPLSTKARVVTKTGVQSHQSKESVHTVPTGELRGEETTRKRRTSKVLTEQEVIIEVEQTQASKKVRTDGLLNGSVQEHPASQDWDDLDADDAHDPLMVSEYVEEIMGYMRELEVLTLPLPDYMDRQKELQWKMRGILVDWLIEVHAKFRLLPETLFLSVNIIDRFLSLRVCSLPKLQLVGITALFIAAKYEEVMCPSIQNFMYMADGGYTNEEILKAEQYVLQVLGYDMSYPNPINFLRRVSKADNYDIQTRTVAKYLMEISLLDHRFLPFVPSNIAASGIYLARIMVTGGNWNANLIHYSGYKESDLVPCSKMMLDYLSRSVIKHEAFFKKYASKKFMKASLFVRDWVKKHYDLEANVRLNTISFDYDNHESNEIHQDLEEEEGSL
uniref:Cell division cycle protein Cdc13 n=1 Tax=Pneumocystis carinii TaxID=4754 RepID=O93916_PNECA|nr:cell division cycle protein Cdc13 [Pneumocystis carinii]